MKFITLILFLLFPLLGYTQIDVSKATTEVTKDLTLPTRKDAGKKELVGKYTFVVELDGSASTVAVKDSMGFGIDEDIVKKLSQAKGWKVAEVNGTPTRISYNLPIRLVLPKK
ncbi:hypothetical protein [Sphingobacterium hungaricum]|uniref:TonB protein C-terminal n=1 Tax=Sphingobacterium hungaricum TaxID=2082723 RepID=A0A928UVA7_9SPHI|nr:hypothetical protein [Sphingobacterium hungaricum]MBE8712206.1 hypothetical protein [Sphingobacterium hungaricum]